MMKLESHCLSIIAAITFFGLNSLITSIAYAQPQPLRPIATQAPTDPKASTIRINLRGETPMVTLVEYVSQRLNIRFFYDETLNQKKINLQVPDELPVDSLFNLLQSALQFNGFALAQTENPNWYKIVPLASMPQVSLPTPSNAELDRLGPAIPVTQVFSLKRGDPNQIKTLIGPFLTGAGANTAHRIQYRRHCHLHRQILA